MKKTIGGDRLGSGKKMKVDLKSYERSSHNLNQVLRTTMACGTLVPYMKELALPGDTFDIDLECDIKTLPTIGPLFGSYKVQLDVFQCPVRLYQGQLHNNKLGIGMNMSSVKLPQLELEAKNINPREDPDNQQINPSSIFSYLDIRGLGYSDIGAQTIKRQFNGIPYLAYWDIYKNYYANKQEEIGAVIHNTRIATDENVEDVTIITTQGTYNINNVDMTWIELSKSYNPKMVILSSDLARPSEDNIKLNITIAGKTRSYIAGEIFEDWYWDEGNYELIGEKIKENLLGYVEWAYVDGNDIVEGPPIIETFELSNIDDMRENILAAVKQTSPFIIDKNSIAPYGLSLKVNEGRYSKMSSQEGLALKTYQSDIFNNWLSTEWIDGENGISAVTAIDTSDGNFTIDTLNLSRKVYNMLNRIAISGGSYEDWTETVYDHQSYRRAESPMYMGGLIKELVFQEVISNAEASEGEQPLGTLAGRGVLAKKHKGGSVTIKVDEPSYIIGIVSITPRIDYSQGNKWDTNLKTMDDFHKPALDEIGFQDLVTDQMAWFDTKIANPNNVVQFKSAGKQPAWLNYMTNYNQVKGNFAISTNQMFMTLNRRYEMEQNGPNYEIKDLTTYIDPVKYNHIFAETARDAQNFWVQIGMDITARRKMSAKIMPNL